MAARWHVSLRVSLMIAVPALVRGVGVAITVGGPASTRSAVDRLADDLFRNGSRAAADRVRALLLRAVPAVETAPPLLGAGSDDLARRLLTVLRANPEFSWVSYADAQGRFTGASRTADGSLRLNRSEIRDGKTAKVEQDVAREGTWVVRRREEDTGYDPGTRPYYVLAKAARRRVWTPPYPFYGSGVPGITCALPVLDRARGGGLPGRRGGGGRLPRGARRARRGDFARSASAYRRALDRRPEDRVARRLLDRAEGLAASTPRPGRDGVTAHDRK